MVRIKIFSDTHEDINGNLLDSCFKDCSQDYDVCIVAGDIGGSKGSTKRFLSRYFTGKTVYFVNGNHQVYNTENKTIQELIEQYKKEFPVDSGNWHFLENQYMEIAPHLYVIGSVFYTDYKYETTEENNMRNGLYGLNDFRWGFYEEDGKKVQLRPKHYLELHRKAKRRIKALHNEIVKKDPEARIILLTHHCLSKKCIDVMFQTSKINASYVSNLEGWVIKSLPNVFLVCSGHIHNFKRFTFGAQEHQVEYIANPVGYMCNYEDKDYEKDLILEL